MVQAFNHTTWYKALLDQNIERLIKLPVTSDLLMHPHIMVLYGIRASMRLDIIKRSNEKRVFSEEVAAMRSDSIRPEKK